MKKAKHLLPLALLLASAHMMQSCLDDDDNNSYVICPSSPKALVTVCPTANGGFTMVLDDKTTLVPSNMDKSPFGNKEVRALVCYTPDKSFYDGTGVTVNRIDSIRTKLPAIDLGDKNDETYGNDPIEIVKDWVTVAEDGYLTLRVRTIWGPGHTPHHLNLLTGSNPDDPFEVELRHDAKGDTKGYFGDALIAFNLNSLSATSDKPVKIKLRWNSFSGMKTAEFDLALRPKIFDDDLSDLVSASVLR